MHYCGDDKEYTLFLKSWIWVLEKAIVNAMYTRNMCPISAFEGITSKEAWTCKKPSIFYIRIFGCFACAKVLDSMREKLKEKDTRCLFLGYCKDTKAFRLMYLDTKKVIKSCDVDFLEHTSTSEK